MPRHGFGETCLEKNVQGSMTGTVPLTQCPDNKGGHVQENQDLKVEKGNLLPSPLRERGVKQFPAPAAEEGQQQQVFSS